MTHFYPGMGATSTMYGEAWRQAFAGEFHDWPQWLDEQTITDMAERVIAEHGIETGDTVVGTSLGGVIACEIANVVKLERIVLIGSAKNAAEVNRILSLLHPLIDLAPIGLSKTLSGSLPSELAGMFAHSDPAFIRNMTKAIFSWGGLQSDVPLLRIHGTSDLVIPPPKDTDCAIAGGHLIVMTHAQECIEAINSGD